MRFKTSQINKILVVSLSNVGDVVLTFPVIDVLKERFPHAQLSLVIGPKTESLLKGNPNFHNIYIFDKHQALLKTIDLCFELRRKHFDLAVDLRNTAIPLLIGARYRTSLFDRKEGALHMRTKHLARLAAVLKDENLDSAKRFCIHCSKSDEEFIRGRFASNRKQDQKIVLIAPGSANLAKRWGAECFVALCRNLQQSARVQIVFVGNQDDRSIAEAIRSKLDQVSINLCGETSLSQLAAMLQRSSLVITNDSAPMHLASYLDIPVMAIFGPSDPEKYGPWGRTAAYVSRKEHCQACQNPKAKARHTCMESVRPEDVIEKLNFLSLDFLLDRR